MASSLSCVESLRRPTTINCDNQAATAIANDEAREKRTRHMSMRLHWVKDMVYQHVLAVRWRPGCSNLADFVTKLLERRETEDKRDKVMVRPPALNLYKIELIVQNAHRVRGCGTGSSGCAYRSCNSHPFCASKLVT
jgi:hypothetical protein